MNLYLVAKGEPFLRIIIKTSITKEVEAQKVKKK